MNISDSDKLQKRIILKKKSLELANRLKGFVEKNNPEDLTMIKRLNRQIFCTNAIILLEDGSLVSHYCGQKTCYVCNKIRMIKFIKKYLEGIKSERFKYFLTLTIKNPSEVNLKSKIEQFYKFFQNSYLKKHPRYKGLNKMIKMIRSFEFTLNSRSKSYHIHLHILLAGENKSEVNEYGELLIKYWKKYFNEDGEVSDDAQYLKEMKKSEIENFKYMTKLDDINSENIYMLYKILKVLTRRRLFMAKNIKPIKLEQDTEIASKTEEDFETSEISNEVADESYINGKKVLQRFYFNLSKSNYIDDENNLALLSSKQINKIPLLKKERRKKWKEG